jgi:hypothetical protein
MMVVGFLIGLIQTVVQTGRKRQGMAEILVRVAAAA